MLWPATPIPERKPPRLTEYRVYVLDERNCIFRPARFVEAVNDDRAIEIATQLVGGRAIEVWHETRLVIRFKPEKSRAISPDK